MVGEIVEGTHPYCSHPPQSNHLLLSPLTGGNMVVRVGKGEVGREGKGLVTQTNIHTLQGRVFKWYLFDK